MNIQYNDIKYKKRNFYCSLIKNKIIEIDELLNEINSKILIPNIKNLYYMSDLKENYDRLRIRFFNDEETYYKNIRELENKTSEINTLFYHNCKYIKYININNFVYSYMGKDEAFDKLNEILIITHDYSYEHYYNMASQITNLNDKYKERQKLKKQIDILYTMYEKILPILLTLNNHINFNNPNLFYKNINKLFLLKNKIRCYENYIYYPEKFKEKSDISETEIFIFNMLIYTFEKKLQVTVLSIINKLGIKFGDYELPYSPPLDEIVMRYDKYDKNEFGKIRFNFSNIHKPPNISDENKIYSYMNSYIKFDINKLLE